LTAAATQPRARLFVDSPNDKAAKKDLPMNTKNLLIASGVGGLMTVGLTNIPILNLLSCLVCVSFWIGPVFAVWLYRRLEGQVTLNQGLAIGAIAGVIAGVIGLLLSIVNLAGVGDMAEMIRQMTPTMSEQDYQNLQALFSGPMLILFNILGGLITAAFGAFGGLIGGAIFKPKKPQAPQSL
jgi:hypothetical protein